PALEGQKIGSGGEMRAQRTHETQAERDDHPEKKEGPAAFLGKLHDLAGTRKPWHGFFARPAEGMPERSPEKTKPPERQAFQGLCSYVMAER
ncbi:hypothetical protein, partial [Pseudomonas aeruginosa]|uniref:hypothetical protein n=1 Tax=Pseudomonas aeruginosa TaxID=287 RepID=UPI001ABCEC4F